MIAHQCACGYVQTGQLYDHVKAPVQYGPRINAQNILFNIEHRIPFAKLRQFWAHLIGYAYNPATLVSSQTALDEQLLPIKFSDNRAERDLRSVEVKQRISGCFRTESGAAVYTGILGFISAMRKNDWNVVDALDNVLGSSFQWVN